MTSLRTDSRSVVVEQRPALIIACAMSEQPAAGTRRHEFMGKSINLPTSLTEAQPNGRACIRCGGSRLPNDQSRPGASKVLSYSNAPTLRHV